jgi:hypothetical protein
VNITIEIPALDRLCAIREKGVAIPSISHRAVETPASPAPVVATPQEETPKEEAPYVTKRNKAKKEETPKEETPKEETPKEETPKEETPKEEITVDTLADLAREYIGANSPAHLRKLLDEAGIKGEKITTCDKSFYPAIKAALVKAIG